MVVRDVFEEGWQGCKSGLQVSTTGGPFLTRTLARGDIYNLEFQYPRCGAVCLRMFLPVLMIGGKCLCFESGSLLVIKAHLHSALKMFLRSRSDFLIPFHNFARAGSPKLSQTQISGHLPPCVLVSH